MVCEAVQLNLPAVDGPETAPLTSLQAKWVPVTVMSGSIVHTGRDQMGASIGHLCAVLISLRPRALDLLKETGRVDIVQSSRLVTYSSGLVFRLRGSRRSDSLGINAIFPCYLRPAAGETDLTRCFSQSRKRRSYDRSREKIILQVILQDMIQGHCDLDVFLNSV